MGSMDPLALLGNYGSDDDDDEEEEEEAEATGRTSGAKRPGPFSQVQRQHFQGPSRGAAFSAASRPSSSSDSPS